LDVTLGASSSMCLPTQMTSFWLHPHGEGCSIYYAFQGMNLSASIDMTCNTKKTVSMVFQPKRRDRIITGVFPLFKINENDIQYVSEFRYLGHIINNWLTDDIDINHEIRNMFTRTYMLLRRVPCLSR